MAYIKTDWIKDVTLIKAEYLNKIEEELLYLDASVDKLKAKDIQLDKRIDIERDERVASDEAIKNLIQELRLDVTDLQKFDVAIDLKLKEEVASRKTAIKNLETSLTNSIKEVDINLQETKLDLRKEIEDRVDEISRVDNLISKEEKMRIAAIDNISKIHNEDRQATNNSLIEIGKVLVDKLSITDSYEKLQTTDKTVIGAINELQQFSASQSEVDEIQKNLQYVMETLAAIKVPLR